MTVEEKVQNIFKELVGERADSLAPTHLAKDIIQRIKALYKNEYGERKASTLGMHLSDWNSDAAFIVALHLFPDRFCDEEIQEGIEQFLAHAPNHIVAACKITDQEPWDEFPDTDPSTWENAP